METLLLVLQFIWFGISMTNITVLSLNVNGLNGPKKRTSILDLLHRKNIDIALLQESHLKVEDVPRCNNRFYRVAASASLSSKTKGVLILVRRSFQIDILDQGNCTSGRIAHITTILDGRKIAFISAYAPSEGDPNFFSYLSDYLLPLSEYEIVLGADMNAVMCCFLDRSSQQQSHSQSLTTSALNHFASTMSLIDIWRMTNPTAKQYSFFSSRHKSYSRIDYIFLSSSLASPSYTAEIWPMSLSDHHSNFLKLNLVNYPKRAPRWRFNVMLLRDAAFSPQFKSKLHEFITLNHGSVEDPRILWNALKGFIRNNSIAYASSINKTRLQSISILENKLVALEQTNQLSPSENTTLQINLVKRELNLLLRTRAEFLIHRSRQNYYFNGSRPSHLLALKLRSGEKFANISAISTPQNTLTTDPKRINDTFHDFYLKLYSSESSPNTSALASFFQSLEMPSLSDEEASNLGKPISLQELEEALKATKKGKSPGLDGIPAEFYLTFWPEIGPYLLDMINYAISTGCFHRDVNIALISLLLKKGKDPASCSSYRPLSLIGSDVKLYAKILSRRLEQYMNKLVHQDQTGFIKSRSASDNIRRLLHIIYFADQLESPCGVFSLDAMKAFDRLEWQYLWAVLEKMGLGSQFISMAKILYSNPSAIILTGQNSSPSFSLARGTRQGCPLSPLLFALSLEPLAHAIRQTTACSPIIVKDTHHYISLYADDILLFVDNPTYSIPNLLTVFNKFGEISGYKINWSKSSFLPLNFSVANVPLPPSIPIVKQFKYLGVDIFSSLNTTVSHNFSGILKQLTSDLLNWAKFPNSLSARISVIKMNVLPRINFIASMIPLPPPIGFWDKLQTLVSKYIWNGKRPRIKSSTLFREKSKGGLSLPNFKLYAQSFTLRPLTTWFDPESAISWRAIEESLVKPCRLQDVVYSGISIKKALLHYGPIVTHLISTWRLVSRQTDSNMPWHQHSPIFNNFHLLSGNSPFSFPQWSRKGINILADIFNDQGLRSFQDIREQYDIPGTSFFLYLQLRSSMRAYGVPWRAQLQLHPLHKIIGSKPLNCSASIIYTFLLRSSYKKLGISTVWSKDIQTNVEEFLENQAWDIISISSKNPNHQLINWKIVHRLYFTPSKRFHMGLTQSPLCTLCNQEAMGTFMHMFWDCPGVSTFWSQVSTDLSLVVQEDIPCSPSLLLLNDFSSLNISPQSKRLILSGTTAAKKLLVGRWNPPHLLLRGQWILIWLDIIAMELSTARIHKAKTNTIKMWNEAFAMVKSLVQPARASD